MAIEIYALLDESDAEKRRLIKELQQREEWAFDAFRTEVAPLGVRVLRRTGTLDDLEMELELARLRAELESQRVPLVGMLGEAATDAGGPRVSMLTGGSDAIPFLKAAGALVTQGETPNADADAGPPGGDGPPPSRSPDGADAPAAGKVASAPPADGGDGAAAVLQATAALLADPRPLWDAVGAAGGDVAEELIPAVYGDRSATLRLSAWATGPELVLLDAVAEDRRPALAEELLRVRAALTEADARRRTAQAAVAHQRSLKAVHEVGLAEQRTRLAEEGVKLAKEVRLHLAKWRSFAKLGAIMLGLTTLTAAVAAGYVLGHVDEIDAYAAPLIIFALALFAASPAVLLLNERPLKGIDAWTPAGAARDDEPKDDTSGDAPAAGDERRAKGAGEARR